MKKYSVLLFLLFLALTTSANAKSMHFQEKAYQSHWCNINNGIQEYKLDDDTRIDCLTNEYAIEFDFAKKWAESVGQSLYYANKTNKKAGVVLILEDSKDSRYLKRLDYLSKIYGLSIWTITPDELPKDQWIRVY